MQNLYKLYQILHKWRTPYLIAALLLILSTMVRMLEPKILQVAIDGVITYYQSDGTEQPTANDGIATWIYSILPDITSNNIAWVLICLALLYIVIAAIRGASMFGSSAINANSTEKAIKRLRDNLFAHLQKLPLSFHSKNTTGEIIQRCTGDVDTVRGFISSQIVDIVLLSTLFISAFTMMAIVHLTYALIAVCLIPFIAITAFLFFRNEQKVWKAHEAEQDKLTSITEENLAGIRVVKAYAKEDFEIDKFDRQNKQTLEVGIQHVMLHAWFWTLSDILVWVQFSLSVFAGGYFTLTQQITVGELISFYTYAFVVTMPMRRLAQVIAKMGQAMVAVDRLSSILDEKIESYEGEGLDNMNTTLQGKIEFQHVSFRYKEDQEYILKDISFVVEPGETMAMVGPTGSGKSTIIALLSRFYDATEGQILIDDKPIETYARPYLRKYLGVVLQKAFLFSTTIKNNIAYTQQDAGEEAVIKAATAAHIHQIIDIFPKGYDTIVGEKGVGLSGGQQQRVALARTLLENPAILVLDDTTSAVDTETEEHIQLALKAYMRDKTTIIIAHRITAVKHADKIIVLDKGEVVDIGTHDELKEQAGFYQDIYEVQAADV